MLIVFFGFFGMQICIQNKVHNTGENVIRLIRCSVCRNIYIVTRGHCPTFVIVTESSIWIIPSVTINTSPTPKISTVIWIDVGKVKGWSSLWQSEAKTSFTLTTMRTAPSHTDSATPTVQVCSGVGVWIW
jgi:hypothetical protein